MSQPIETRQHLAALQVRDDGRTLVGIAVPYGVPARIGGRYDERFALGAFTAAATDPSPVRLLAAHDHEALPIGRAITLTETPTGLAGEFRVSDTTAGRDVLALVRDGVATGLSVGFVPEIDAWNEQRTSVTRIRAQLVEVSVVAWPAYEAAGITAMRSQQLARTRLQLALRRT